MSTYRVVTGPKVTLGGKCCGAKTGLSGTPFEAIINEQAKDGYEFVEVFSHSVSGAFFLCIPDNVNVNLLVFKKA